MHLRVFQGRACYNFYVHMLFGNIQEFVVDREFHMFEEYYESRQRVLPDFVSSMDYKYHCVFVTYLGVVSYISMVFVRSIFAIR